MCQSSGGCLVIGRAERSEERAGHHFYSDAGWLLQAAGRA